MPKAFVCSRGHNWTVELEKPSGDALACIVCPQCGEAAVSLAEEMPPESATTPGWGTHPADAPDHGFPELPGYEIVREVGRGGMGVVYQARQLALHRTVAVKMIWLPRLDNHPLLARFSQEAQAVAKLQHPHIVQIYEVGETKDGPFIALEYVSGGSLAQRLQRSPQPPREAARLVELLARAMQEAHRHGIVHRDLKPANVLLTADGTPKIADFGLAKDLKSHSHETHTGAILGTPSYMAPEQAAGDPKRISFATDVYALGAILYEMLTGRPPFRAATPLETLEQVRLQEPVAVRQLQPRTPRDLETICLKCLHKDPSRRYAAALDLAEDLQRFQQGAPIRARPTGPVETVVKWCRRHPAWAALLLVSALALGTLLVGNHFYSASLQEALKDAVDARNDAESKKTLAIESQMNAEASAKESLRRTVRLLVANGMRYVEAEQYLTALPYLAEALKLEPDGKEAERLHRLRLGLALQECPRLVDLYHDLGSFAPYYWWWGDDSRHLLFANNEIRLKWWDSESDKLRDAIPGQGTLIPPVNWAGYSPPRSILVSGCWPQRVRTMQWKYGTSLRAN